LETANIEIRFLKRQLESSAKAKQALEEQLSERDEQIRKLRVPTGEEQETHKLQYMTLKTAYESLQSLHEETSRQHQAACLAQAYGPQFNFFCFSFLLFFSFFFRH